ncbi:MAG: hypothetical protein ACXVHT_05985, partial [Methanobacterium sp.]
MNEELMSRITDMFEFIFKNSIVMKDSNINLTPETSQKPFITFNKAVIVAIIVLVSYISILSWINESYLKMVFSDVISPIIEIAVALCVFYAAKLSSRHRRVQIAWTILGVSVLFYAVGDIIWAIMELFLHQQPFPSIADFFYLSFFPLFALGIYYLPKISL